MATPCPSCAPRSPDYLPAHSPSTLGRSRSNHIQPPFPVCRVTVLGLFFSPQDAPDIFLGKRLIVRGCGGGAVTAGRDDFFSCCLLPRAFHLQAILIATSQLATCSFWLTPTMRLLKLTLDLIISPGRASANRHARFEEKERPQYNRQRKLCNETGSAECTGTIQRSNQRT